MVKGIVSEKSQEPADMNNTVSTQDADDNDMGTTSPGDGMLQIGAKYDKESTSQ